MATKGDANKKTKRPTAIKREEQDNKRRLRNKSFKSEVRTIIRAFEASLKSGDQSNIQSKMSEVYSIMDKGVKRGIFKINKASRTKARITAKASGLAV